MDVQLCLHPSWKEPSYLLELHSFLFSRDISFVTRNTNTGSFIYTIQISRWQIYELTFERMPYVTFKLYCLDVLFPRKFFQLRAFCSHENFV
jgi:hypothetical protein